MHEGQVVSQVLGCKVRGHLSTQFIVNDANKVKWRVACFLSLGNSVAKNFEGTRGRNITHAMFLVLTLP